MWGEMIRIAKMILNTARQNGYYTSLYFVTFWYHYCVIKAFKDVLMYGPCDGEVNSSRLRYKISLY